MPTRSSMAAAASRQESSRHPGPISCTTWGRPSWMPTGAPPQVARVRWSRQVGPVTASKASWRSATRRESGHQMPHRGWGPASLRWHQPVVVA
jgi:hypothetical protein